ncbi:sensor domain-containing protein [Zobellella maritima]|uniref:sensor domain-containing protein n=1 Tax=Zobellella maritima TaxID=2059725 RepID=UPI000E302686|nr:GGDEF domain-containing protein [Zobellella maritima]
MKANACASLGKYMDLLLDAICVVDKEGRFVYVSAAGERIFGYSPEEMIGRPMIELVFPEDRERTLQAVDEIISGEPQPHFENRYVRKDGQVVNIMWSARWSEADQLRIAVARDITRCKHAEQIQAALYAISEAVHEADDLGTLFQRIHKIIGALLPATHFYIALYDEEHGKVSFPYHAGEHDSLPYLQHIDSVTLCNRVIRGGQALLLNPEDEPGFPEASGGHDLNSSLGVPLQSRNGTIGALIVQSRAEHARYTEKDRELLQFVSRQIADAIERKQMMARLQHIALYDQLTRLPNRALLHDRIQLALAKARRNQGQLALLYLDMDKFKEVNDTLGHATGDLLLDKVARRLELCVRECDTLARLGGDEFVILLESIELPEQAALVAAKIRHAFDRPFELAGRQLRMLASIGIALFPLHGSNEEQLLRYADEAMYSAKKSAVPGRRAIWASSGPGAGSR